MMFLKALAVPTTLTVISRATMNWPKTMSRGGVAFLIMLAFSGCASNHPQMPSPLTVPSLLPSLNVPQDVQRIAVFYPRSSNPDFRKAYQRLEGETFQLKSKRPTLKIVDRLNLRAVITEQRFQVAGVVTGDSAVRIGHLLGVDSVLLYSIDGPTLRDRFFANRPSQVPPIIVTTKIIRVESAEVVYHDVVIAYIDDEDREGSSLSGNMSYHELSRAALERGIEQTVFDLRRAFQ